MGRRGKIDEYKLAEHLKTGVTDKQAGIDFENIVSRQSITLKRAKFEKLDQSDPRWLPPRAELVISKRGRRRKSHKIGAAAPSQPQTLPDYQLREYIQQTVRHEIKEAIANLLQAITSFDDVVAERDEYKKRLTTVWQEQKAYWAAKEQGQVQAPLTTNPKKSNNLGKHDITYIPKPQYIELNKLPLLNIKEREIFYLYLT